jgi:branched-chain amino acid transport system substrate-binding protein
MLLRFFFLFCALGNYETLYGFNSLKEAHEYAAHYPESITPDTHNEFNPVYESFYKKHEPKLLSRLKEKLSLTPSNVHLDIQKLKNNLLHFIAAKRKQGFRSDKQIMSLPVKPGDKMVIWGDLQGAFHSLLRGLEELKKQGIINEDFTIKKSNYYIVFNANMIGRTPYNLETINLILSILQKNPNKAFAIQGKYETQNFWTKASPNDQLRMLEEDNLTNPTSLAHIIQDFFDVLPLAIYINYKQGSELFRISGFGQDNLEINESLTGDFFIKKQRNNEFNLYNLYQKSPTPHDVQVRLLVQDMEGITNYVANEGLINLPPRGGTRVWAVFSSPTRFHMLFNQFYYDAFVILTFGKKLDDLTADLYNHDTRMFYNNFTHKASFYPLSGDTVEYNNHKHRNSFVVGSTLGLSGNIASMSNALYNGMISSLHQLNKTSKYKVKLVVFDDEYMPNKARNNIDYLMKHEKTDVILLPTGSPTLEASLELLQAGSILALFPVTGATKFRFKDLPGIINLRASYRDEVFAMMSYLIKKYFIKNFAFFYQDDAYGKSALEAAREILKTYGITTWAEIPYQTNTTDFTEIIKKINQVNAQAIGLFSTSHITQELFHELGVANLVDTQIFGLSFLVDDSFYNYAKSLGINYTFARVVPNPATSMLPIVKEYRKIMSKENYPYSSFSLEGYIGMSLLFQAIKNIKGPLNMASIRAFFESLNNYEFGGFNLTFNPETRELNHDVWLDTGKTEWFRISNPEKEFKKNPDKPLFLTELEKTTEQKEVGL